MKIIKNEFVSVECFTETSLFKEIFTEKTENMTIEQGKQFWLELASLVKKYKPKRMYIDARNFRFVIVPELQVWMDENLSKVYVKNGLKRMVIVESSEIFTQVSMEQTLNETNSQNGFETQYFDDAEEAQKWVLEN